MKKIIVGFLVAVFVALPSFVSAGYSANDGNIILLTRLEVSKDNTNWVNYLAEENSGGQTLTVSPGDTVYLRLKTWNTGISPAVTVQYTGSYTNPQYIDALDPFHAGVYDDLDGDTLFYYGLDSLPDLTAGTMSFHLDGVLQDTDDQAGYQGGEIVARVKAETPDQTVILATVQINSTDFVVWWKRLLFPRAYADDVATTQVRLLVSNPPAAAPATQTLPVTGPDSAFAAENSTDSVAPTTLPSSNKYLWTRAKEWMNTYLFTYKKSSKAKTLDRYANERVNEMQYALSQNDNSSLDKSLDRYSSQKSKALEYAKSAKDQLIIDQVKEETLEQQKIMTEVQLQLDNSVELQNRVVEVQKDIADKIVNTIIVVQGDQAGTVVAGEIKNVWYAAGTTAGSAASAPAGWTYAPGTSGSSGAGGTKVEGDSSNYAPGTEGDGTGGQTVAPGN